MARWKKIHITDVEKCLHTHSVCRVVFGPPGRTSHSVCRVVYGPLGRTSHSFRYRSFYHQWICNTICFAVRFAFTCSVCFHMFLVIMCLLGFLTNYFHPIANKCGFGCTRKKCSAHLMACSLRSAVENIHV